jgi:hypothetical protein
MGNFRKIENTSSIFDPDLAQKYLIHKPYPIPMNIALPAFDWNIVYHQNQAKGIIYSHSIPCKHKDKTWSIASKDTIIDQVEIHKGDLIKYESVNIQDVKNTLKWMNEKGINYQEMIIFNLDSTRLSHYEY